MSLNISPIGSGGGGDVEGPASSTNRSVAIFDGTTGKLLTGSALFLVDTSGIPQWGTNALPTANSSNRGKVVMVQGGAGVSDTFLLCIKDETDTYLWVPLF